MVNKEWTQWTLQGHTVCVIQVWLFDSCLRRQKKNDIAGETMIITCRRWWWYNIVALQYVLIRFTWWVLNQHTMGYFPCPTSIQVEDLDSQIIWHGCQLLWTISIIHSLHLRCLDVWWSHDIQAGPTLQKEGKALERSQTIKFLCSAFIWTSNAKIFCTYTYQDHAYESVIQSLEKIFSGWTAPSPEAQVFLSLFGTFLIDPGHLFTSAQLRENDTSLPYQIWMLTFNSFGCF